jgi:hypothetical protein
MKIQTANKEHNYSLYNIENYRKNFDCDIGDVVGKYSELLSEYYKFAIDNIKLKNTAFSRFIINRGLDTITNVFYNIFYYTKNVDLTYFHCQKSFYFYVEFVGQISEDEKMFLQLTSRDAATYVYKKTIFEINNDIRKSNESISEENRNKIDTINTYINLYKTNLQKIINSESSDAKEHLVQFEEITAKLTALSNRINKAQIIVLENVIEKLFHVIEDCKLFFDINHFLIKKFSKSPDSIKLSHLKIYQEDFSKKILDGPDKFIAWFIN